MKINKLGIILIILGILLICYSFKRTNNNNALIKYIRNNTIDVNNGLLDSKNDNKIVRVYGNITTDSENEIVDNEFGIHVDSVKLKRVVEIYQWDMECDEDDENCKYKKVWSEELIDSDDFKEGYENPKEVPYQSKEFYSNNSKLGDYNLNELVLKKLKYDNNINRDDLYYQYNYEHDDSKYYNITDNYITSYEEDRYIKIGDFRIHYEYVDNKDITVLGLQSNNTFKEFNFNNKKYLYVYEKEYDINDITKGLKKGNNVLKGIFIFLGVLLVWFGYNSFKTKKSV